MGEERPIQEGNPGVSGTRLSGWERRRAGGRACEGEPLLARVPPVDRAFRPGDLFEVDRPVELEVGCGKGAFLVAAGEFLPGVNFIGVEVVHALARTAAARAARRGLGNVRVISCDAKALVSDVLAGECLAAVHVLFPDPWPKKRHHKRRLFSESFLGGVERVLVPGGVLCFATDFVTYYERMRSLVDSRGSFERLLAFGWRGEGGVTNFERKYLRSGRTIHRAVYRKRSLEEEWRRM